jgi:dimethylamine/trimethylamine dehydrogenase
MVRDPRFDPLFEPIRIGPKTLRNRFVQPPQCTGAGNQRPGASAAHRAVKAEGGWAALCTESCSIHPQVNTTSVTLATLWDRGDVLNHRHMTDEVHRWGALAGVQLGAGGVKDNLDTRYVAPAFDAFPSTGTFKVYTHDASEEDIHRVMSMYVEATRRARDAGFDIIYLHAAAGVFPVHALSRHFNRRKDRYGGSFANRARFALEALEGIREAVDGECAVAVRLTIDDLAGRAGIEAGDEALRFVALAEQHGLVDLWDVIVGGPGVDGWAADSGASRFHRVNHQAPWNSQIKSVARMPVVGVGRFTDPEVMLSVIRSGQIDIIGCARPSIADPWLPRKIDENRIDDIRECIGCNLCIARFNLGVTIGCTQNATVMEEYRRGWHPEKFEITRTPCPVLVVGAGPAGLECARVLGERGYEVHLCEAGATLGGHLRDVVRMPGLAEWERVISWRETQLAKLPNVTVMRGVGEVEASHVLEYGAPRVVLATGAAWATDGWGVSGPDPVPGVDASRPRFITPEQLWAGKEVGDRVVVLDGDGYFMAVGIAEILADRGKRVTIVTHHAEVAPMTDHTLEGPDLRRMMREKGIGERTVHWVESVETAVDGLRVRIYDLYRNGFRRTDRPRVGELPFRRGDRVEILECDSVILCTGRRPRSRLYHGLADRRAEWPERGIAGVARAGDCLAPRYLIDAVFDGHRIAREFESPDPERPAAMIRERQIWGNDVVPMLGDPVL